jgi:hypothetical protein
MVHTRVVEGGPPADWAFSYRRFWEESFDKLEVVVNQMKKAEVGDDKKRG